MTQIPFICLTIVCVVLGVLNTIFYKLLGWKGVLIRGIGIIALLTLSLVTANLRSIGNAFPLFITIALAVNLLAEATMVSMEEGDKLKPIINGVCFSVSSVLFALSAMSLAEPNILALLGGLFVGLGFGLVVCSIRKNKGGNRIVMNIISFTCVGLLMGFGISAVLTSRHLISAILMLLGGVAMLIHRTLVVCGRGKTAGYLASAFLYFALITLSISIYFY